MSGYEGCVVSDSTRLARTQPGPPERGLGAIRLARPGIDPGKLARPRAAAGGRAGLGGKCHARLAGVYHRPSVIGESEQGGVAGFVGVVTAGPL